jgi:hypothetical protein
MLTSKAIGSVLSLEIRRFLPWKKQASSTGEVARSVRLREPQRKKDNRLCLDFSGNTSVGYSTPWGLWGQAFESYKS